MSTQNSLLNMPENLSETGKIAYAVIMEVLKDQELDLAGCKAFSSPLEWNNRGELHGLTSHLIVVYSGGQLGKFFSLDKAEADNYFGYEKMNMMLRAAGLYFDECSSWYGAVHSVRG